MDTVKLIRLTPTSTNDTIPVVSVFTITAMEQRMSGGRHQETVIYTARQGVYHRVLETPDLIEALLNGKRVVRDEDSLFAHQLADIDQIICEHEMEPLQFTESEWWAKLKVAADGTEYDSPR